MGFRRATYKFGILCGTIFTIAILLSSNSIIEVNFKTNFKSFNKEFPKLNYVAHSPIVINSDDDFITYGFSGMGTSEDPYIIENYNITTSDQYGIRINDTTKHFLIRNCFIIAQSACVLIQKVASGSVNIINNTCSSVNIGIRIFYSVYSSTY